MAESNDSADALVWLGNPHIMKPFLTALLVSAIVLFACHKSKQTTSVNPVRYSTWQWVNYFLPVGPNGETLQPAHDSMVTLFLDGDSNFNIRINDSLVSAGYYRVTPDSLQMVFSIQPLIYPNGPRLCLDCALSFSTDRDTLTLSYPVANPRGGGTFTFIRSNVYLF